METWISLSEKPGMILNSKLHDRLEQRELTASAELFHNMAAHRIFFTFDLNSVQINRRMSLIFG